MQDNNDLVWHMCCRGRRSKCPQVAVDGHTIYLKDDFGGQIVMTMDQFQDVVWRLKEIISQRIPHHQPGVEVRDS